MEILPHDLTLLVVAVCAFSDHRKRGEEFSFVDDVDFFVLVYWFFFFLGFFSLSCFLVWWKIACCNEKRLPVAVSPFFHDKKWRYQAALSLLLCILRPQKTRRRILIC
jgi:hypothetical protein